MTIRVYVPSTTGRLRELLVSGGLGPAPLEAHAVTDSVRSELPDMDVEEWEYVVLTAAAQESLGLLSELDQPRRVVVVAEADSVGETGSGSLVELDAVVSLRQVVAVHADSADAADDVLAAREAWALAHQGDETAQRTVDRCEDHELGWFATQEVGNIVGD